MHTLIATGVNAEGYREILGAQVTSAEGGAGWLMFFRDLVARGCPGSGWSPATRTPGWWQRSVSPCPGRGFPVNAGLLQQMEDRWAPLAAGVWYSY